MTVLHFVAIAEYKYTEIHLCVELLSAQPKSNYFKFNFSLSALHAHR